MRFLKKWNRILSLRFLVYVTRGHGVIHVELMHSQHDRFNVVIAILFRVQRLKRWFACLIVREIKSATDVADTNCDCFAFRSFSCSLSIVISIRDVWRTEIGKFVGTKFLFRSSKLWQLFINLNGRWKKKSREEISTIYLFFAHSIFIAAQIFLIVAMKHWKARLSGIVQYSYSFER